MRKVTGFQSILPRLLNEIRIENETTGIVCRAARLGFVLPLFVVAVATVMLLAASTALAADDDKDAWVEVNPRAIDELLANPGIGWETFHKTARTDKNLPAWLPSTIQYVRWGWNVMEPAQGKIDYEFIDRALDETHAAGQQLAFRVMCCSPYKGRPYHPEWLQEIGGKILMADHDGVEPLPIPDMGDPVVLEAHLDFIRRLGERYDGHPHLKHVEIGSIGWWGEWHLSRSKRCKLPSLEYRMKVVDAYLAAFKQTPLVMLLNGKECTTHATQHGAGWRADSLGDLGAFSPNWTHMRDGYPNWIRQTKVEDAWKRGPIAFEPPAAISQFTEKGWPLRWIFNYGLALHGSSFSGKSGRLPDDEEFRRELTRFLKRLGYRLVLRELRHPATARAGERLQFKMQWQNVGSAPCYRPYRLAYRLTDARGDARVFVGQLTVDKWLPGSIELFTEDFFRQPADLPPGDLQEVTDAIELPKDLPAGSYELAVAVVGERDEKPVVGLAIAGRGDDGWYPLSRVTISR
ncbi:MAG: DUF4832 domain-containing protein [Planctomycetota bacterium]